MRALALAPDLTLREVAAPEPEPGEALVRVRLAGICNTDVELVRGYMGFRGTLGHEFVGEVAACDDTAWLARRVVGEINLGCGSCPQCRTGMSRHCAARRVLGILEKDGCFAELLTLPVRNLHAVPEGVPDAAAVFIEPLAAAYAILEQVDVGAGDRVLVLGDGKLGLLIAMALAGTGCGLHLAGRHPRKLALAEATGATPWRLPDLPIGAFDLVVEATGSPQGLALAIPLVRPRGRLVLKSTFHGTTPVALAPLVVDEITLVGSRCGLFPPALDALASGAVDPTPLVSDTFPLDDGVRALERAQQPGVLKILLRP